MATRDVEFTQCGAKGCKYRWNWACRTTCFKCNAALKVPAVAPKQPGGAWGRVFPSTDWAQPKLRDQRRQKVSPLAKDNATNLDPFTLLDILKKNEALSQSAEQLAAVENALLGAKARERANKPLSVQIRHLEEKIDHKKCTRASAQQVVDDAELALAKAQTQLQVAKEESQKRETELQNLQKDMAELLTKVEEQDIQRPAAAVEMPMPFSWQALQNMATDSPELAEKVRQAALVKAHLDEILAPVLAALAAVNSNGGACPDTGDGPNGGTASATNVEQGSPGMDVDFDEDRIAELIQSGQQDGDDAASVSRKIKAAITAASDAKRLKTFP